MGNSVKCKCGEMPVMDEIMNNGEVYWRLECPHCGAKDAPWRRSQLIAVSEWEEKYYKL